MSAIVVDASIIVALLIPEVDSEAAALVVAGHQDLVGPPHLYAEVGNALLVNARRGVIDEVYRDTAIGRFFDLGVVVQTDLHPAGTLRRALAVADRYRLTVYDALYLDMAQEMDVPLASFDHDLRQAARQVRIPVAPE